MKEKHLDLVIAIIMILCVFLIIIETSLCWVRDNTNSPQKSPVSQTRAPMVFESGGSEIWGVIDNKTQVEIWTENGTELTYKGTLENYSVIKYKLVLNKSLVDSVQIGAVQP